MTQRTEVLLAALLLVAGIVSLSLQKWVFVDPTAPADWQAAAAWVQERAQPDDIIRIEPHWAEAGLVPLQALGSQVNRIRDPLLEDLYRFERVFIVSERGREDRALAGLPFEAVPTQRESFGEVTAIEVPVPSSPFLWELRDELAKAKVSRVHGDDVEHCGKWDPRRKRWNCAKPDKWTYVGEAEREVGDDPRKCVWAHPLDRGRTLRLEADVPASRMIRVRDSFDLRAARLGGADVLVQVFVNDELALEDRVSGNDDDWEAHDIDVSHIDGPAKLRIEVDLLGPIKNRFLCVNAWALR